MSEQIIVIGTVLFLSSSALFHLKSILFGRFLKDNCPQIWESHISKNGRANILVRYQKLRSLPHIYESDNIEVNRRLRSLAIVYKTSFFGILVILIGAALRLVATVDA